MYPVMPRTVVTLVYLLWFLLRHRCFLLINSCLAKIILIGVEKCSYNVTVHNVEVQYFNNNGLHICKMAFRAVVYIESQWFSNSGLC